MINVKYAYLLILILASNAMASGPHKEIKSDINKDGKIDYVESFQGTTLVERKEDLNFDGTFDRQTLFSPNTPDEYFKVVNESKYGKNPKRRISFWHYEKSKLTFSLTQLDLNDDGKWDKEFQSSSEMNQHKDECSDEGLVTTLAATGLEAAKKSDDFTATSWGHQIHKSCLKPEIKDFVLKATETAVTQGLSCLKKLGEKGGMGAARNFASLKSLLATNSVQVICDETDYDWTGTLAHATTSADGKEKRLRHPGLSMSPEYLKVSSSGDTKGQNKFISTIFHEQMHNLGYLHQDDIEFQYTCERCCFPNEDVSEGEKEISCKICSGNYDNVLDKRYLKDISKFAEESFRRKEAIGTNLSYVKANPDDPEGLAYLAQNLSGVFDPVGGRLAEKIRESGSVTDDDNLVLRNAELYNGTDLFKPYTDSSKIIANAFYASYKKQNPAEALELLKKNAATLKAQMKPLGTTDQDKYVAESLKSSMKRVVYDIWLNHHSGSIKDEAAIKKLNNDSYELQKLFDL